MKSLYAASLVVVSAAATAACDNGGSGASGARSGSSACRTFRTTLAVRDRMSQAVGVFNSGEPITFELRIANSTNNGATLMAGSSCTAVVFEVSDSANQRRWGNADGIACVVRAQPHLYAPFEVVTESSMWNQKDSAGVQVPTGDYVVTASVGQYLAIPQGLVNCPELGQTATLRIQ
jgi:hypothetical protein